MNDRLQELADHCWKDAFHYSPNGPETYTEFDYDKFAELIVRECANLPFKSTGEVTTDGEIAVSEFILKHFGVEE